ncbi:hypothetical protein FB45DRAFT_797823 [Roridomyces roridus]|uniref:DUF829-domain-containing protein n=1 Tax=Roridomyces roridus TaxID=1738132 RepID=A0AAD7BKL4_9AGAR|nr:hypothetical protein FB45DRAFT_797823 [Roridomyces roridus]
MIPTFALDPTAMSRSLQTKPDRPAKAPPVELQKLSQGVHISYGYRTAPDSKAPSVVLIFGFMDGPLRLLGKYISNYRKRWPSTDIILVESTTGFIWSSEKTRAEALQPLVKYLISTVYGQQQTLASGILCHALSNGGAFQLMTLSRVLHSMLPSESPNFRSGMLRLATIIDSAPGAGEFASLLTTLGTNFQSPTVKALLPIPVSVIYAGTVMQRVALNQGNLFVLVHQYLEREELLPLADVEAPRTYIYSTEDHMVPFSSVEAHLAKLNATSRPFNVAAEKFSGSAHVSHERRDPGRYWNAIWAAWERSCPIRARL